MRIHTASQLYPTYKQSVACMRLPFLNFTNYERAIIETHTRSDGSDRDFSNLYNINKLYKTKTPLSFLNNSL